MGRFIITQRKNGEFQFNLEADNGEVILTSEGYASKPSCKNGIKSVKKNAKVDSRFVQKTSANGKYHFNLKAINGQVIGSSEMYNSKSGCTNGIESVKKNAPAARILDKSK